MFRLTSMPAIHNRHQPRFQMRSPADLGTSCCAVMVGRISGMFLHPRIYCGPPALSPEKPEPGMIWENRAVIAAMLNRFALFTHRVYPTFTSFIRAYSTPLQPALHNKNVARHNMNDPRFEPLGGTYPGTDIPRDQLKRHIALQKTP